MQGRIKVLKDVDKSNILPMTHAKAVYVDEKNTLDKTLNNIESYMEQQRKTYAELKELVDNKELIPGVQCVLTDYRTKYIQPTTNVLKEMGIEELVLTANSESTFEPIVSSLKYPEDVVYYDFNNNICEDKATPRNGFILRRYDPISKNDAPQDWRSMLWARYKPDANAYIRNDIATGAKYAYDKWTTGNAIIGRVYKADNKLWMAKNNNVPTSPTDSNIFYEVYPDLDTPLLINEKTKIAKDVELIRGDLVEVKTFGDGCRNNKIESRIDSVLHNNVIIESCANNTFGNGCYNNTVYIVNNNNSFGNGCYNNIILSTCRNNTFGNGCYNNYLPYACTNNSFGNECRNNSFGTSCYYNSFGSNCYNNSFNSSCYNNSFDNSCYNNSFGNNCHNNSFGNNCYDNSFGYTFLGNSFDNECHANTFGNNCRYNHMGAYCFKNSFGNSCSNNNFGNSCDNNNLGDTCTNNNFGNSCTNNNFGSDCRYNSISGFFTENEFGTGCSHNSFKYSAKNTFGDKFQYNTIKCLQGKKVSTIGGFLTNSSTTVTIEQGSGGTYLYWYVSGTTVTVVNIP